MAPLLRNCAGIGMGALILAAARELGPQWRIDIPSRWLRRLGAAFGMDSDAFFENPTHPSLPPFPHAAWMHPSLLGELLCASRVALEPARAGRSGRVSAGSVYTPAHVARAIVAEVHVGARRVIDPACGAGVFLLEAFQRGFKRRCQGGSAPEDAARSTLMHELCGIDIDAQALAVAEFSLRCLALRCSGLREDVPIDLRCSNALEPLGDLEGNCECIVGNPPYVEGRGLSAAQLSLMRQQFRCASSGKVNLFAIFVERSLALLKSDGVMALVLPATFQRNARYRMLREELLRHTIESIKPLPADCFGDRVVETVVLRVRKRPPLKSTRVQLPGSCLLQSRLPLGPALRFGILPPTQRRLIDLMERHCVPLEELFDVRDGISTGFQPFPLRLLGRVDETGAEKMFVAQDGTRRAFDPSIHRKIIDGCEFNSFTPVKWAGRYIEYDKTHEHQPPHPGKPFNCQLRDAKIFDRSEKLISRQTARGMIVTVDRDRHFVRNSVHVTYALKDGLSLDALCACLNSAIYTEYLLAATGESGDVFPQVHVADVRRLPILPALLKEGSRIAQLGTAMLTAFKQTPADSASIALLGAAIAAELNDAFALKKQK